MASADEARPLDAAESHADALPTDETATDSTLKRKASEDERSTSPKRTRHDEASHEDLDNRRRQDPIPARRESRDGLMYHDQDRRASATQEEKKRGKRLFGGLLNTLSQKPSNTQQRRRQEIERRQQERMQKQRDQDDRTRTQNLSRIKKSRMAEQIVFEEQVLLNKHAKMLAMARFLQTSSKPKILYLPWKLTETQEDEIKNQIEDAKARIAEEMDAFDVRKQQHIKEHGPSEQPIKSEEPLAEPPKDTHPKEEHDEEKEEKPGVDEQQQQLEPPKDHHRDHHDESADVLEEADEDMVIY